MVPISRLQEFGFDSPDKFPQHLIRHTVTLSLPSAMDHGLNPLDVVIEDGLVIPQQASGASGGMIIKNDGMMLYIAHQDEKDSSSPLASRFIKDIPYDARSEANNIMRRAVEADPSLAEIWNKVCAAWTLWFPLMDGAGASLPAGKFKTMPGAWNRIGDLLSRLIEQVSKNNLEADAARVKIVVQSGREYRLGWLGEEFVVDETSLKAVILAGKTKYLLQDLFPRMQKVLRNPVFSADSKFHLYYGSRRTYLIKLVIVSLDSQVLDANHSVGLEFTLADLDGFSPYSG